jgi:pilus assembly protein Flp/PilA
MLTIDSSIQAAKAWVGFAARAQRDAARRGQGLVEYALVIMLIAIVLVLILTFIGNKLGETFSQVGSALG